jgi:hypothetical protein
MMTTNGCKPVSELWWGIHADQCRYFLFIEVGYRNEGQKCMCVNSFYGQTYNYPCQFEIMIEIFKFIMTISNFLTTSSSFIFKAADFARIQLLRWNIPYWKINPQSSRGIFHQNYLKTAPIQSKIDYAKFESPIVHLTVRSCTQLLCLHVHQILHTHSSPFAR